MNTTAPRTRRKNPHAVAMRRLQGKNSPLDGYGDLTAAQRRLHYSWVRRVAIARAATLPAPPPPPWISQRVSLRQYGYNERTARILQADATAWRGCESLLAYIEHLPSNRREPIRANLRAMARGIEELLHLAGADEIRESMVSQGMEGRLAKTG